MKIDCISDTHLTTALRDLPGGDILIHAGDALNNGYLSDLNSFKIDMLEAAKKYKHILYVPGNHDVCFETNFELAKQIIEEVPGLVVLHDKTITINGIKFYGTSWQPFFYDWAFNVGEWKYIDEGGKINWTDSVKLTEYYSRIPGDTQVLITHCPPYGIRDNVGDMSKAGRRTGSLELLNRIVELKELKAHVFGHIHYSQGAEDRNGIKFINAAICDENYDPINPVKRFEL